jgi:hypothetical protein
LIGGIIGGVVALLLIVVLIAFLVVRNRRAKEPQSQTQAANPPAITLEKSNYSSFPSNSNVIYDNGIATDIVYDSAVL